MDQLNEGLRISLSGPLAESAVAACRRQIAEWGLSMPDVPPLVLDFGLNDFERFGLIEYWIANEIEAGYCGKFLFVSDGQSCPRHRHRIKKETFFIVRGEVWMEHGEERERMGPGSVLPMPPGVWHGFTGIGPALLLEVSKPCVIADNEFADPRIPIGRPGRVAGR